jgi:iron(III) transport system ATP-binding protein
MDRALSVRSEESLWGEADKMKTLGAVGMPGTGHREMRIVGNYNARMSLLVGHLSVAYPGSLHPAVQSVSFSLASGDIGVLIGPSGCGKTTLLRAIAGLEPVCGGSAQLNGRTLADASSSPATAQGRVGMVFQDYALFPHLSVQANVAFGLRGQPKTVLSARVRECLERVGLADLGARMPHELSGGQQQRVALARALAPAPELLLLDEPFSNLDVDLRERLAHEVRDILKAAGATALFVTHDQLEAFAIGDAIGVMRDGVLHQWDDAFSLYHRPASRFVAEFIGHGVFLPGHIVPDGGTVAVDTPVGRLQDRRECPLPGAYPQRACELLLRADDIVHDDSSPVQARIVRRAFRGAEFLCTLELDSGHQIMALIPSHHDHAVGDRIGIRAEVDHVVTFAAP